MVRTHPGTESKSVIIHLEIISLLPIINAAIFLRFLVFNHLIIKLLDALDSGVKQFYYTEQKNGSAKGTLK